MEGVVNMSPWPPNSIGLLVELAAGPRSTLDAMKRAVAGVVVLVAAVTAVAAVPGRAVAAGGICPGSFTVGSLQAINLTASHIRSRHVACATAHGIVRAYLSKKLYGHPRERCAAASLTRDGCRVNGFVCRAYGTRRPTPEVCSDGNRHIWFRELDKDSG
jgi:hypothetical protein